MCASKISVRNAKKNFKNHLKNGLKTNRNIAFLIIQNLKQKRKQSLQIINRLLIITSTSYIRNKSLNQGDSQTANQVSIQLRTSTKL
jgi:hypothetical protein